MSFNINEMLSALSSLTSSMTVMKENGANAIDYSAITPTIIGMMFCSAVFFEDNRSAFLSAWRYFGLENR